MNSPLATYVNLTDHHSGKRTKPIDRITPHCIVGQWTAKQCCDYFATTTRECSSNYAIGKDGEIGVSVDEDNRSWCSSTAANDQRAVTIECASDKTAPYAMTDKVYESLIKLCIDICKRHNKTKLIWIADKETALNFNLKKDEMLLTVHRWFANKSCPGDWLYSRLGDLASKVTAALSEEKKEEVKVPETKTYYCVQVGAYSKKTNAERQLAKIKAAGFSDAYITTKVITK